MAEGGTIRLTMVDHCIECDAIPPPQWSLDGPQAVNLRPNFTLIGGERTTVATSNRQRRVRQPRRALSIQRRRCLRPSISLWLADVTAAALNISTSVWGSKLRSEDK
jgi:hypothetical protein